jgi:hypothetical protein
MGGAEAHPDTPITLAAATAINLQHGLAMNTHSTRNWMKLSAIAVFVAFGSGAVVAQVTNVSMVTQIALSGVRQNGDSTVAPVRIANKDILNALNATGRFSFASSAQIILLSFEGQLPNFAVRERNGTDVTTTDISDFFFITEPQEIHSANHLSSYAIYVYNFDNGNGTSFTVSGLTLLHAGTITGKGISPLTRDRILTSTVNGSGAFNGATMDVRGTVHGGSAKAEVD